MICPSYSGPPRGAGDAVHSALIALGVEALAKRLSPGGCDGCQRRRDALNRAIPFTDEQTKEH